MSRRLLSSLLGLALLLVTPLLAIAQDPTPIPSVVPVVTPVDGQPTPAAAHCPAPAGYSATGVTVGLDATFTPGQVVSFGLPLPAGVVRDAGTLSVTVAGQPVSASVKVLLNDLDASGAPVGVRSVLVQLPASVLQEGCGQVDVAWQGGGVTVTDDAVPFAETSAASDEVVDTATYAVEKQGGAATLVTKDRQPKKLFEAREPAVQAMFPAGYLAATGILGHQVDASNIGPDLAGLKFISEAVTPFGLSAMDQESYPINSSLVIDPTDPENGYEGWLYDRCATFLSFYTHTGDVRFLREGYRVCSYYAGKIELSGENRGIFTGKPDPDIKYSHPRGLYAYYALTGDEAALNAGTAIADLFLNDQEFVGPYLQGHTRGPDKLWTERLLAVSLEGLFYGHRLTGDVKYLTAAEQVVDTAYRHITGNAAALAQINPGATAFPPQNCFIHTAEQAAEGDAGQPWCSGWMPALLIDPLLAYQDQTGDAHVDEIFIRLTRFLRDIGTAYFDSANGNADDTFMHPAAPSAPPDAEDQRVLVPLYGAGIGTDGKRFNSGEYDDYEHCLDATSITAAGLRALKRTGGYDQNPIGPFASEGESFLALHEELAYCAADTFANDTRPHRDPATWTGPDVADELTKGLADPASFITDNNIGNVSHQVSPQRKISWWFNESLEEFALLREAGIAVPALHPGVIQPSDANYPTPTLPAGGTSPVAETPTPLATVVSTSEPETPAPPAPTPTPVVTEGGAAGTGAGEVVYVGPDGHLYRVAARASEVPVDLSLALDRLNPATDASPVAESGVPDHSISLSADGQWLLIETERFDPNCAGWACLAVLPADLSSVETVQIDGQAVHPSTGAAAIASEGNLVVYADAGGPHEYDLWATTRQAGGWSAPRLLTADSPYPFHGQPAISVDGGRVLFNCGNQQYFVDNTAICEVGTDGTGFRVLLTPADGPAGSAATGALRHPSYAPDGSIVFESDWDGLAIWRLSPGATAPERVGPAFDGDSAPCVLTDGRIASLWQDRPGNSASLHEPKIMTPDGTSYIMLVTGEDIGDIGCGG